MHQTRKSVRSAAATQQPTTRGERRRTIALRIGFAAAVLLLPAELLFQRAVSQPYPAVFQPSFASTPLLGDTLSAQVPIVHVLFDEGEPEEIPFEDVLPDARLLDKSVFKSAFFNEARATAPDTVAWVTTRLRQEYPGRTPVQMVVDWTDQKIDVTGATPTMGTIIRTVTVDLERS